MGLSGITRTLLTIFIPTLMVQAGILLNRSDASRLDARISSLESSLDGRLSGMDGRIGQIEGRLHADMLLVVGKTH